MPPKGKKKVYGKAPELPSGEVLVDHRKRRWKLGKAFASGGFGRIYTATSMDELCDKVVVKMEPAENGPLFQEMHVYQRILNPEAIASWKNQKGLKFFGIPPYLGSGKHVKDGLSHRFLVMPAFGKDLEHFREASPQLDVSVVAELSLNIINCFEFLHNSNYVHADVKAENLLLENSKSTDISRMFLVDFGLAKKVPENPLYKEDPRKAHDGTLIFTSLDAHRGCPPCYRGDVEILGYNIIYWLTGDLPWFKAQNSPEKVFAAKQEFSENVPSELKKLDIPSAFLAPLTKFFQYIYKLDYAKRPDYDLLRQWLIEANKGQGSRTKAGKSPAKIPRKTAKKLNAPEMEFEVPKSPPKTPNKAWKPKKRMEQTKIVLESSGGSSASEKRSARKRPSTDHYADDSVAGPSVVKKKKKVATKKAPLKPSIKINNVVKPSSSEASESDSGQEDVVFATPSPEVVKRLRKKMDPISPAVRKNIAGEKIIPGVQNMALKKDGSKIIPGLANFKPRRSIETTLVKRYVRGGGLKKAVKSSPKEYKAKKFSVRKVNSDCQTSPNLWFSNGKDSSSPRRSSRNK